MSKENLFKVDTICGDKYLKTHILIDTISILFVPVRLKLALKHRDARGWEGTTHFDNTIHRYFDIWINIDFFDTISNILDNYQVHR